MLNGILCSKCNIVKLKEHFYNNPKKRGQCKSCVRIITMEYRIKNRNRILSNRRKWRTENKDKINKQKKIHRLKFIKKVLKYIDSIKKGPCMDCNQSFPIKCMDFDHRPGEIKHKNITAYKSGNSSMKVIKREIAKCDLVCGNCHRLRTFSRYQKSKNPSITTRRRAALQDFVNSFKIKCELCNMNFKSCQLDFDHLDPQTKKDGISNMVAKRMAKSIILEEIKKCRIICVNCHRLLPINRTERSTIPRH